MLTLTVAAQAFAAEVSGKGSVTFVTSSEVSDLKHGNKLVRTHFKGVVLADDPKSSLHKSLQDCSGTTLLNKAGEQQSGAGYCAGTDPDGDIWWISWRSNATGSDWSFIGGTGKHQGTKGGGKTLNVLQTSDRLVISWEGSWTTSK
ncbi:MAG: hypothetical protein ACREMA_17575 [Longimicrobiales bacterium]